MTFNKRYLNLNRYFLYATYFAVKAAQDLRCGVERVGWGERFCEPQHPWCAGIVGLAPHSQPMVWMNVENISVIASGCTAKQSSGSFRWT